MSNFLSPLNHSTLESSLSVTLIDPLVKLLGNPPDGIPNVVVYAMWMLTILVIIFTIYKFATRKSGDNKTNGSDSNDSDSNDGDTSSVTSSNPRPKYKVYIIKKGEKKRYHVRRK